MPRSGTTILHALLHLDRISTAGYNEGVLFARWLLADELPETPEVELRRW